MKENPANVDARKTVSRQIAIHRFNREKHTDHYDVDDELKRKISDTAEPLIIPKTNGHEWMAGQVEGPGSRRSPKGLKKPQTSSGTCTRKPRQTKMKPGQAKRKYSPQNQGRNNMTSPFSVGPGLVFSTRRPGRKESLESKK